MAIAGLAALIAAGDHADARGGASERSVKSVESRAAGEPIMAIVSLKSQRITVYDAQGWIVRAAVSTGQKGRETPAGIFSVIQKEAEHYSNLYDDAYMPHMQRLTWSGIALHGGPLPGYPASHGCIRMPFDFAEGLFGMTRLGLRVIVAPADVTPIEIAHPLLFSPKPGAGALASARTADAGEAARKADQARLAAVTAFREAAQARVPVRTAENLKRRAEAQLASAEAAVASAVAAEAKEQAEADKAKASARIAELEAQWAAANAQLQPKLDALKDAREAAAAAEAERVEAAEAAREAARQLAPVSVLISRKTRRLYVRQGLAPIFESPVTILDPDRPIGTHVITATELINDGSRIRWTVVSLQGERPHHQGTVEPHARNSATPAGHVEPLVTEQPSASAALDRIVIPQDALDRIPGITPRSSLIITDEALSAETGKGTDFVVLLSDQPQGGIKFRRRSPPVDYGFARARDRLPYWRAPLVPFSTW